MENKIYKVGIIKIQEPEYPEEILCHPSEDYPEYPFKGYLSKSHNYVYEGIRNLFFYLDLDKENFNKENWNPLGEIIKPGDRVVIKPNFVLSKHYDGKDIYSIITHPSVIRAILDYCCIALKNEGEIIIADAPQHDCNFKELLEITKLDKIVDFVNSFYKNKLKITLLDLRDYYSKGKLHFPSNRVNLPGDPLGKVLINLGKDSAFYNFPNYNKLYGAHHGRKETIFHHYKDNQEYEISKTILSSDVFISIPKMKVHKKVGVTLNLKNLVGIVTNKNTFPHYTLGSPSEGGDQYPEGLFDKKELSIIRFERWMYDKFLSKRTLPYEFIHRLIYGFFYLKIFRHFGLDIPKEKRILDAGNWYGNDTAWRGVFDLAKIIHFSDKEGYIHDSFQRKFFSVVDGVVGGENNGPLLPDPKPVGLIIGGDNLLAVDLVTTRTMGFDPMKLKQFSYITQNLKIGPSIFEEIIIKSNISDFFNPAFYFKPHPGWKGYIEI
jgi:uncharacterized protein (DUF362 family)